MSADHPKVSSISTPAGFHYGPVDYDAIPDATEPEQAPLGVLKFFHGNFTGRGFNTIFRPNNGTKQNTPFTTLSGPPIPQVPNENVLQLNLTTETLSFADKPLGSVPNRGLDKQGDIFLNGVAYTQSIQDVANEKTGKADAKGTDIHFEPGLWIHVPQTDNDPVLPESLARLASIPHGTTINAQTLNPPVKVAGPPKFARVDITPFPIGFIVTAENPNPVPRFPAQTAVKKDTPRLPQDLTNFIREETITQEILDNPNIVLAKAIEGQKIVETIVFEITTDASIPSPQIRPAGAPAPPPSKQIGGGTANIAFLEGTGGGTAGNHADPAANAEAISVSAVFWIETVEHEIPIPIWSPGHAPITFTPKYLAPEFSIIPPHPITVPRTIKVQTTQIQYSQIVNLNFAKLTWPHVSVATLVPAGPQGVPSSAWIQ